MVNYSMTKEARKHNGKNFPSINGVEKTKKIIAKE